jgi:hypothetical protein
VICEGDFVLALTLFDFSWSTASMKPPTRDVAERTVDQYGHQRVLVDLPRNRSVRVMSRVHDVCHRLARLRPGLSCRYTHTAEDFLRLTGDRRRTRGRVLYRFLGVASSCDGGRSCASHVLADCLSGLCYPRRQASCVV